MDLYREDILEHYRHPKNFGELPRADASAGSINPACGDQMVFQLSLRAGRISDIRFHGESCAISRAGASMLTEAVKGKTVREANKITEKEQLNRFGVNLAPGRRKCALLPLVALKQTLGTITKTV